jgi:hypothetical protein
LTNRDVELTSGQTSVTFVTDSNQEPTYQGLSISQWIQTKTKLNSYNFPLSDLLTLKQVYGPDDWGIVKFEVPVNFDALKANHPFEGNMHLGVLNKNGDFVECCLEGFDRAKNGHCIIWWTINWNAPGQHNIRTQLTYYNGMDSIEIIGPPLLFDSSNACQFFEGATFFNSEGTQLYAKLRSSTAKFRVELTNLKGKHLKTIIGSTASGYITNEWDLVDERGKKFKGDAFDATFYVTYPDDTQTNWPAKVEFTRIADPNP